MVAAIAAANGSLQLWAVLFVGGGCDRRRQRGLCAWTVCRAQSRHVGQLGKRRQRRWLDEAEGFFQDWGATAVVVGRWLPLARFTVALPAGINRMPWRRFVIWNALGGISWVTTIGLAAVLLREAAKEHHRGARSRWPTRVGLAADRPHLPLPSTGSNRLMGGPHTRPATASPDSRLRPVGFG